MGGHALPGMDDPGSLLNVLEMWMGLVFRSLPRVLLEEWMPDGISAIRKEGKEGVFGGLNIRSPLDQGDCRSEWIDLSEDDDPLVRAYASTGAAKSEVNEDEVEKRKKEYAEKARKRNLEQKGVQSVSTNGLMIFGLGVIVGIGLVKGFSRSISRR